LPPGKTTTDEVALLEVVGVKAHLVRGSADNLKVTRPGDEKLAAFLLERREASPPEEGAPGGFPS
jgi:2-C-methyl-D-erythritol 4-phosphate cytidylyltransferase